MMPKAKMDNQVIGYKDLAAIPKDKAILDIERPDLMIYGPHFNYTPLDLSELPRSRELSDGSVRRLSEELSQREEVVQKLQKEKEHLVELSQLAIEDLQSEEEKVNLLTKERAKLQVQAENFRCLLDQERHQRGELEKTSRKLEGDSRSTIQNLGEMEMMRSSLEELLRKMQL
ncbi:hypothetical protein DPEC_G00282670 [Dallia pectoralis]|uniref:Uncharacterized protein n=1 Tax=Dallia pectoralis TaxID=75939 RepID=A0ACC2FNB7_DALPE|nr:hypothetical protein DPEC_G00282670 [Dallia pectoralis]